MSNEEGSQDLERALGRLTMSFSSFELLVANSCRHLMGLPADSPESAVMVAGLDAQTLLDKFCSLYRLRDVSSQETDQLEKFRRGAAAAVEKRNRLIHGTWVADPDGAVSLLFRLRAKAKRGLEASLDGFHAC